MSYRRRRSSRKSVRALGVACVTMLCAAAVLMVARADDEAAGFKQRVYVGAGVGATRLEPKTYSPALDVSNNTDTGYHVAIGYDFTSRLSAEIYYADLGAADIAFLGSEVGDISYQVYGLSGLAYLYNSRGGFSAAGVAAREGLSLYGRVGVGGVSADSELDYTVKNNAHLALGLGAEYGFRNGFAVRAEYKALDTDQHYATIGLIKRFGQPARAAAVVAATTPVIKPADSASNDQSSEAKTPELPFPTVNFDFDKSVITPEAARKLDAVANAVKASDVMLVLEGHTDWISTETYNYDLSLRRAENVRRYLEGQGIARSRFSLNGFGETRPIASNATVEGRASNRRVDIRLSN